MALILECQLQIYADNNEIFDRNSLHFVTHCFTAAVTTATTTTTTTMLSYIFNLFNEQNIQKNKSKLNKQSHDYE